MYYVSGAEAAAGFMLLLFASHWYDAFLGWGTSALTYVLAARAERLEHGR
jgi:hypothetical protein